MNLERRYKSKIFFFNFFRNEQCGVDVCAVIAGNRKGRLNFGRSQTTRSRQVFWDKRNQILALKKTKIFVFDKILVMFNSNFGVDFFV